MTKPSSQRHKFLMEAVIRRRSTGSAPSETKITSLGIKNPTGALHSHPQLVSNLSVQSILAPSNHPKKGQLPQPQPLFLPSTLITGDSVIRSLHYFMQLSTVGTAAQDMLNKLRDLLPSLPSSILLEQMTLPFNSLRWLNLILPNCWIFWNIAGNQFLSLVPSLNRQYTLKQTRQRDDDGQYVAYSAHSLMWLNT